MTNAFPSPAAVKRLKRIEQANRARARRMGCKAVPVDFVHKCHQQGWVCAITGVALDPELPPSDTLSISLDHHNPLSNGGAHDWDNVRATTLGANLAKAKAEDTPRAAKRKRQAKKLGLDSDVARAAKAKTRQKLQGRRLQSRGFQTNRDSAFKKTLNGKTVRRDA